MEWGKGILCPHVLTEYGNVSFTDFQSSWCQRMQVLTRYFPGGSVVKNLPANTGDLRNTGLIPGSGRSLEEGNGKPLQYSCLENPMDRESGGPQSMASQRVGHDWASLIGYWGLDAAWTPVSTSVSSTAVPNIFGIRDWFHGRQFFQDQRGGGERCFRDDSNTLHLLCTLFLLLLHRLHLGAAGIRSLSHR